MGRVVKSEIPSLRWSLFWMGMCCFLIFCCVLNIFDDPSAVGGQAILILLFFGGLVVAHKHYLKVIEQREAWRKQRAIDWWLHKDLPAPGVTDWEAFERQAGRR